MRHRNKGKILSRLKAPREALVRDLATSLVLNGKIRTTEAKAKLLRRTVEHLITLAKAGTITSRRAVAKKLYTEKAVKKMMEIAPTYADRKGGYTRILKIGPRKGDGAHMVLITFT